MRKILVQRYPGVRWQLKMAEDRLVDPPTETLDLLEAARNRVLEENWDLAVVLTEIPLKTGRRPVLTQSYPVHGVGLVSVPNPGSRARAAEGARDHRARGRAAPGLRRRRPQRPAGSCSKSPPAVHRSRRTPGRQRRAVHGPSAERQRAVAAGHESAPTSLGPSWPGSPGRWSWQRPPAC